MHAECGYTQNADIRPLYGYICQRRLILLQVIRIVCVSALCYKLRHKQ